MELFSSRKYAELVSNSSENVEGEDWMRVLSISTSLRCQPPSLEGKELYPEAVKTILMECELAVRG